MHTATRTFPARLHVLLASDAPLGVVFRRGPSKKVCTFLWHRKKNTFTLGQWLNGRIYERRADLSPDGNLLIYFAMNGRWDSRTGGSWTAISEAPWLKALALYAKGDCWEGGGLWLDCQRFWLNDRHFVPERTLTESSLAARAVDYGPPKRYGSEDTGVYYPRLERDGWILREHKRSARWKATTIFEKPLSRGRILRKIAHEQVGSPPGKGCYWDEHELIDAAGTTPLPEWDWADVDGNRLVWAERGCLFSAPLSAKDPQARKTLLRDFNADAFERVAAPY
jgi:hypothetical protein